MTGIRRRSVVEQRVRIGCRKGIENEGREPWRKGRFRSGRARHCGPALRARRLEVRRGADLQRRHCQQASSDDASAR